MWLNKLKAALVLEQIDSISSLLDEMPQFSSLKEMEQATYILQQCMTLLEHHKSEAASALQQLRNTLIFLKSSDSATGTSLNLKF
ncbi:MAG: hypothetical protein PHO27_08455 [Sulfuricurvum sp.]|nr:hypothetical protein [Sulfuricurvum sp.]